MNGWGIGYYAGLLLAAAVSARADGLPPDGADWPAWRGNAAHGAVTARALPAELFPLWVRKLEAPAPAWPETQPKIRSDASYEPVVAGKRLFVGSMTADRVAAYDTETGAELWRFYADGPVRFAPLAWRENVYVVSDDGYLYCLEAATGKCRWRRRGGPGGRLLLGNERLISAWPARGAPVLREDPAGRGATLYFAASIWPFMGIFIDAVDAETGDLVWVNSGSGSIFVNQQHNSPAFAGAAPHGYLTLAGDRLLVPGGRTVPAVFDRTTGAFLYFKVSLQTFGKDAGGYDLGAGDGLFVNHGCLYNLADGEPLLNLNDRRKFPGLSAQAIGETALVRTETGLDLYDLKPERTEELVKDREGKEKKQVRYSLPRPASLAMTLPVKTFHFRAGDRVYGSGDDGVIGAVDLPPLPQPGVSWTGRVDGAVWTMIPADDKLFVVTLDGAIHCFGKKPAGPVLEYAAPAAAVTNEPSAGYALFWGLGDQALARLSELAKEYRVIAVDPDAAKVAALRLRLDEAGLFASRVQVLCGRPAELKWPPYLASRIEFGDPAAAGLAAGVDFARAVFACLRPYGGMARLAGSRAVLASFETAATAAGLPGARLEYSSTGDALQWLREGALPGSASWTHQYADVANTVVSQDDLVKPPLGLLWFGGPSNADILPRHGHGPSPQVAGGRLFIEGPNALRAVDVYTGRLLWQRELPGLGKYYDNTSHQPGAGEIGANYVSLPDGVYVVHERQCLLLDPATGRTVKTFALPAQSDVEDPYWGYVGVYEDLLIAGSTPLSFVEGRKDVPPVVQRNAPYAASSQFLVVMDRHSGNVLWQRQAKQVFRHNAIAAGGGAVFCIDAVSKPNLELLKRRGEQPADPPRLLALEARTGKLLWQAEENVGGTWLGYSAEHDVLLESGSPSRDRARDEAQGRMTAYRGRDGVRLWLEEVAYNGTPMLHGGTIYTDGAALELLTGRRLRRANPVSGESLDWSFKRNYGCNTPIGGRHMLLFRSAAAGYYDLAADAGTANWGGFKSGCTANLIPADGVLSAPDYTRTCTCSYQNQCSLALVSMPEVEVWTFQSEQRPSGPVKRAGINFGAPGDWSASDGTLWMDYPSVGGGVSVFPIAVEGAATGFRRHALEQAGAAPQVTASGMEGVFTVRVALSNAAPAPYTVRLYFSEPAAVAAGERLFDVRLQGETVLTNLDVFAGAGGRLRGLVREFPGVPLGRELAVELRPANGSKRPPLLCGLEMIYEDKVRTGFQIEGAAAREAARRPAGSIGGLLEVSNATDQAVSVALEAGLEGRSLIRRRLALPPGGVERLTAEIPADTFNRGKTLDVDMEIGDGAGKHPALPVRIPLQTESPLALGVVCPSAETATIQARNRRMDAGLAGRLVASLEGKVLLEKDFALPPGGVLTLACPLPPGQAGRQAELELVTRWAPDVSPVPGRFAANIDFRDKKDAADAPDVLD